MRIRRIIVSWDFGFALAGLVVAFLLTPGGVDNSFAKDVYGVGITVLSIIFSVYFASLAIIMSSSDDDFVGLLESKGDFTAIVTVFEDALYILFAALLYSLAVYTYTALRLQGQVGRQDRCVFAIFAFLFVWGLLAAVNATHDSIAYSKFRSRFVLSARGEEKPEQGSGTKNGPAE